MPREWSTTLVLALIQALLGHRAVSQAILSKCALAKDQVATWTYSHGRAIFGVLLASVRRIQAASWRCPERR